MQRNNVKQRIIDTSFDLFREKGYKSVSVMDICNACGITKPTFYKYIDSKDSLLKYFSSTLTAQIPEEWFHIGSLTDHLQQIIDVFDLYYFHTEKLGIDLYTEVFAANLKEYQGAFNDVFRFNAWIEDLIRLGQESGQIKNPSDPHRLMSSLIALSFGNGAYRCMYADPDQSMNNLFQSGLKAILCAEPEEVR